MVVVISIPIEASIVTVPCLMSTSRIRPSDYIGYPFRWQLGTGILGIASYLSIVKYLYICTLFNILQNYVEISKNYNKTQ